MKRLLQGCGAAALLAVCGFFGSLTTLTWMAWQARNEAAKSVAERVDPVLSRLTTATDSLVLALNGNPKAKTAAGKLPLRDAVLGVVDQHLTNIESTVNTSVDKVDRQLTAWDGTVNGLGSKLDPVLSSYTRLGDQATGAVIDARQAVNNSSDDLANLLESSEVAVTSVARAGDTIAKAMPVYTEQAKKIGDSAVKVGDSAAIEAAELTKPKTALQKALDWVKLTARVVAVF